MHFIDDNAMSRTHVWRNGRGQHDGRCTLSARNAQITVRVSQSVIDRADAVTRRVGVPVSRAGVISAAVERGLAEIERQLAGPVIQQDGRPSLSYRGAR